MKPHLNIYGSSEHLTWQENDSWKKNWTRILHHGDWNVILSRCRDKIYREGVWAIVFNVYLPMWISAVRDSLLQTLAFGLWISTDNKALFYCNKSIQKLRHIKISVTRLLNSFVQYLAIYINENFPNGIQNFPNSSLNKFPKTLKIRPNWRNFAKPGHTSCNRLEALSWGQMEDVKMCEYRKNHRA